MSFIRAPNYRTRVGGGRPVKPDRKPKKTRKKPWDDSLTDLSMYRATAEEQERRKLVHQSQNVGAVKQDQLKKRITKARKTNSAPNSRRNVLMKEVLFNHSQLEDVLTRSDKVMAVVKDLFGDDPKKFRGLPRITVAPDKHDHSSLPGAEKLDQPSKLDALSESVMDRTALNDLYLEDSADEGDEEEEELSYEPVLDFDRFQKFLLDEQEKVQNEENKGGMTQSVAAKAMEQVLRMAAAQSSRDHETEPGSPHVRAINDTGKIKKTMARTSQGKSDDEDGLVQEQAHAGEQQRQQADAAIGQQYYIPADPSPEDMLHLQSLKTILGDLEGRIAEYECTTGRNPTAQRLTSHTVSGYLLAVADNVSRLFGFLRQTELRLRAETTLREQLGQDLFFMKSLVDTLTEDIISMQEEDARQKISLTRFQQQHAQDIAALREELINQGIQVQQSAQPSRTASVPSENESVTTEDLASQMQQTLRLANMLNHQNPDNEQAHSPQQPYQHVVNGTGDPSSRHNAPRLNSEAPVIHYPKPLHPGQFQLSNTVPYESSEERIVDPAHMRNDATQMQATGRPVPVFYSESSGTTSESSVSSAAPLAARLLSPPKQCDSPKIQGGKYQASAHQIQQVVQSMRASNTKDSYSARTNQYAGLGHFHDVSGISSSMMSTRPTIPAASQVSATTITSQKDEKTTREMLQAQIAELNRQHAEAQQRIRVLYEEQQNSQKSDVQELVSPPISPIPPASESETASETNQAGSTTNSTESKILAGRGMRGITVSLPRVETVVQSPDSPPHQLPRRGVAEAAAVLPGGSQQAGSNQVRTNGWLMKNMQA